MYDIDSYKYTIELDSLKKKGNFQEIKEFIMENHKYLNNAIGLAMVFSIIQLDKDFVQKEKDLCSIALSVAQNTEQDMIGSNEWFKIEELKVLV